MLQLHTRKALNSSNLCKSVYIRVIRVLLYSGNSIETQATTASM